MAILWTNGHIYTMVSEKEKVDAVVTEHGKIIATGNRNYLIDKFGQRIEKTVDLKGAAMLPGFVDSHLHLIGLGEVQTRLDFSKMTSKEEVLSAVKEKVERSKQGEWIIGEGWDENLWDKPLRITKEELDKIAPSHPVVLKRICRHMMIVNSKALRHRQRKHQNRRGESSGRIRKAN